MKAGLGLGRTSDVLVATSVHFAIAALAQRHDLFRPRIASDFTIASAMKGSFAGVGR